MNNLVLFPLLLLFAWILCAVILALRLRLMKLVGALVGASVAIIIAFRAVRFTSAVQGQKTIVLAFLLALVLCPVFAFGFGKLPVRSRNLR